MNSTVSNLLTRAVLQRYKQDEGKAYLQVTGKLNEVRSDVEHISQYGFRSRPLAGSRGLMVAYNGNKQNATVICVDDKRYGSEVELEEGDVLVYNELSARILLRDDKIIATADEEISATVNNSFAKITDGKVEVNVNGSKTETTDGQIKHTVGSNTFTLTSSGLVLSLNGKTFTFNGSGLTTDGDVTSNGIVLDSHVHSGVTSGPSNTGGPL